MPFLFSMVQNPGVVSRPAGTAVRLATVGKLTAPGGSTIVPGPGSVGAESIALHQIGAGDNETGGPFVDGVTTTLNDLVLLKNEGDVGGLGARYNGIYKVIQLGNNDDTAWIMQRVSNAGVFPGTWADLYTFKHAVSQGTNAGISYQLQEPTGTLDTDAQTWVVAT